MYSFNENATKKHESSAWTLRKRLSTLAALLGVATFVAPVALASSPGLLRINNLSNVQQEFIVNAAYNCMDGIKGGLIISVGPYSSIDHVFYKNDGSCSGDLGVFSLTPKIDGVTNPNNQKFLMNGEGGIVTTGTVPDYPSWVDNENYNDAATNHPVNTWNVELPGRPPLLPGRPKGYWAPSGCSGGQSCSLTMTSSIDAGTINQEDWSQEFSQSVSLAITAGLEVEAAGVTGSLETTFTSSSTGTVGSAQSLIKSKNLTAGSECTTPTDMTEYDIYKIWQWVVSTPVGDDNVIVKTCDITCTPDGSAPTYLPGWPEAINACKWKKGEARPNFAPVEIPKITPPAVQRNPQDSCVRFYSGDNGGGRMKEECTDLSKAYTFHRLPEKLVNGVQSYKCGQKVASFNAVKKSGAIERIACGSRDQIQKIPRTTIDTPTVSIAGATW